LRGWGDESGEVEEIEGEEIFEAGAGVGEGAGTGGKVERAGRDVN
jgi:hypothetical protein